MSSRIRAMYCGLRQLNPCRWAKAFASSIVGSTVFVFDLVIMVAPVFYAMWLRFRMPKPRE